jgi:hypothetical protein
MQPAKAEQLLRHYAPVEADGTMPTPAVEEKLKTLPIQSGLGRR